MKALEQRFYSYQKVVYFQTVWAALLLLLLQQRSQHPAGRQQGALLCALLQPTQCSGRAPPAGGSGEQQHAWDAVQPFAAGWESSHQCLRLKHTHAVILQHTPQRVKCK